jgi:hypothetical protein
MTVPQDHPVVVAAQPLIDAVGASLIGRESITAGDIELKWEGAVVAGIRLPPLHGALAIRLLDEQGAFILRRAVEDVADAMKVSRITVYNYLNALHR